MACTFRIAMAGAQGGVYRTRGRDLANFNDVKTLARTALLGLGLGLLHGGECFTKELP